MEEETQVKVLRVGDVITVVQALIDGYLSTNPVAGHIWQVAAINETSACLICLSTTNNQAMPLLVPLAYMVWDYAPDGMVDVMRRSLDNEAIARSLKLRVMEELHADLDRQLAEIFQD